MRDRKFISECWHLSKVRIAKVSFFLCVYKRQDKNMSVYSDTCLDIYSHIYIYSHKIDKLNESNIN